MITLSLVRQRLRRATAHLSQRSYLSQSMRAALFTFVLTRVIIFTIFVLVGHTKVMYDATTGIVNADLRLQKVQVARILRRQIHTADANWYLGIAVNGYERISFENTNHHNWGFFPLFPLLVRAGSSVTGQPGFTGMVLSHLFFFFALLLLHKTALAFGLDTEAANRTIFYLAICPVSYFFSLPLTESLFLLLTVGSFYCAKTQRWWLAGLCGALASATRAPGVLLLPALAVLYFETYRSFWPPRKELFALCLIPAGLLAFMIYLHSITGNAFAFTGAMKAWGRGPTLFLSPLLEHLKDPLYLLGPWNPNFLNFWGPVITLICGLVLLRRHAYALACYTLMCELTVLSTAMLQSQARYAMVVFPAFMVLATWGKNPWFDTTVRTVSLVLLSLMSALFAANFTAALA